MGFSTGKHGPEKSLDFSTPIAGMMVTETVWAAKTIPTGDRMIASGEPDIAAQDVPFLDIAARLEREGVQTAPGVLATARDAGALAAARLGSSLLWIKSVGEGHPRFCMELQFPEDLPLGFVQAARRSTASAVLVQRGVDGPSYRLYCDRRQRPMAPLIAEASLAPDSPYRVVMELTLPIALDAQRAEALRRIMLAVNRLLENDPRPWLEIEAVWSDDGPVLTDVWLGSVPTEIMAALRQAGLDEVMNGKSPERALAVAWLRSRSGVIRRIEGVERAQALRSIVDVCVRAQPGDIVGHVVDKDSRDRLGYVMAAGATPTDARNHALHGRGLIFIETEIALG